MLRTQQPVRDFHPLIPRIAASLRSAWQGLTSVSALPMDGDLAEIRGELEGDAMAISNQLLCCPGVRKIHLETAQVGRNLDILHCVLFPDPCYDLPIFGADVVVGRGAVSAAIVDLSPTGASLPERVVARLQQLPNHPFSQPREVPSWGTIFSPHVLFVRPTSAQEEDWFLAHLEAVHGVMLRSVEDCEPQPADHPDSLSRHAGQLFYCQQQRRNDKTRRVLEMAFDSQWADRYIQNLLFDDPPTPGEHCGN
ncbi:MAG: phycocyanobilin:ferredoxin oxidoreductase [Synechococcus sp. MED-G71]|nr:MAG: phycocyanobilin:ferredoxin oxidoreductase [Synechococcus sp. MED-G71]